MAAESSSALKTAAPTPCQIERWLGEQPSGEKDALLLQLATAESPHVVRAELLRRFRTATAPASPAAQTGTGRTVAELLAKAGLESDDDFDSDDEDH